MARETGTNCYFRSRGYSCSDECNHGTPAASGRQAQQHAYCLACYCGAGWCLMVAVQSHLHGLQEHLWGVMRREVW